MFPNVYILAETLISLNLKCKRYISLVFCNVVLAHFGAQDRKYEKAKSNRQLGELALTS